MVFLAWEWHNLASSYFFWEVVGLHAPAEKSKGNYFALTLKCLMSSVLFLSWLVAMTLTRFLMPAFSYDSTARLHVSATVLIIGWWFITQLPI